jgi:hypothetical protein
MMHGKGEATVMGSASFLVSYSESLCIASQKEQGNMNDKGKGILDGGGGHMQAKLKQGGRRTTVLTPRIKTADHRENVNSSSLVGRSNIVPPFFLVFLFIACRMQIQIVTMVAMDARFFRLAVHDTVPLTHDARAPFAS